MSQNFPNFGEICEVMEKNYKFLMKHADRFLNELQCFINDPIECMEDILNVFGIKKETKNLSQLIHAAESQCMIFFVHNILFPTCQSAFINVLIGNLPGFCRDLRFLIESLAKCYWADKNYKDNHVFKKWELLSKGGVSEREFIQKLDQEFEIERAIKLWGKLSEEAHLKGYLRRVGGSLSVIGMPPTWALTIPNEYWEGDIDEIFTTLKGYHDFLCEFREILQIVWKKYITNLKETRTKLTKSSR